MNNTPILQKDKITKKALVVEDEHDLRVLYAEILTDAGFEVVEASNGETGIEEIKHQDWDILLLDIMLPGMDGVRILKEIKEGGLKKGPIVLLTAINNENIIKEAFDLGADGYLIKSEFTPDKVLSEVTSYLDKYHEE